jgi:hypothetical protein
MIPMTTLWRVFLCAAGQEGEMGESSGFRFDVLGIAVMAFLVANVFCL